MTHDLTALPAPAQPVLANGPARLDHPAERKSPVMPTKIAGFLKAWPRSLAAGALALGLLPNGGLAQEKAQASGTMLTDYFEVALVNDYDVVWRDSGSGAKRDLLVLRPRLPAGFSSLGDVAIEGKLEDYPASKRPYTIALKARPGFEDLLSPATGGLRVWESSKTEAKAHILFDELLCQDGHVALGAAASGIRRTNIPGGLACLSTSVLTKGLWENTSIWDDKGTGAPTDLSLWSAEFRGAPQDGTLIIPVPTFIASKTHAAPDKAAWVLRLPNKGADVMAPIKSDEVKSILPTLSGPTVVDFPEDDLPPLPYTLQFYQVHDPDLNFFEQWRQSPVYQVVRTSRYEYVTGRDNTGDCERGLPLTFTYSTSVGTESSSTWGVNASASVTVEGKGGFKPLGVGGELSVAVGVTVGGSKEWGSASSKSTEISDEVEVPPGVAVALFKLTSEYRIFRQGANVPIPSATAKRTEPTIVPVIYRLPGSTVDNPCPRSDILLSGPAKLTKDKRYTADHLDYYLLWDDRDLAVYTDTDNAVWKFSAAHPGKSAIKGVAISNDGQITVTVAAASGTGPDEAIALIANPNRTKGTALYLTDTGSLQVVTPKGVVVWDSLKK